ncbi:MAG: short-chain dehydrogenase, partial [Actinomycetota bacterium]
SKAAVTCLTEALAHQLAGEDADVTTAVFYPGGGLLDTGLWTAQRNRPEELQRQKDRAPAPGTTFEEFRETLKAAGRPADVADLLELGRFVVEGVKERRFIIGYDLDRAGKLLHARADAIAEGDLPPNMMEML